MNKQYIKAYLLSSLVPVVFVLFLIQTSENFQWNSFIVLFALFGSYLGTLVFGMPIVFLLRGLKLLNLPVLVLSGTVMGVLVFYIFMQLLSFLLESASSFTVGILIWGAVFGFTVSITFGLISGITRRLTRTAAAQPLG